VRAMVTPQFGGPDLFEERDVERPHPGPGEILVRVVAAGTNPVDAKLRASGNARGLEAPIILGADISGIIAEVGPGVTEFGAGDEVYYTPETSGPGSNGSYAESIQATRVLGRLASIISLKGDLTPGYQLNQTFHGVFLLRERARLDEMTRLIERGQMRPLVEEVLPLEEVGKAHERLDSGHGRGKVVLRITKE
jgi:NADPH:quinone reductase-like Zn-dependent oxidoreductase